MNDKILTNVTNKKSENKLNLEDLLPEFNEQEQQKQNTYYQSKSLKNVTFDHNFQNPQKNFHDSFYQNSKDDDFWGSPDQKIKSQDADKLFSNNSVKNSSQFEWENFQDDSAYKSSGLNNINNIQTQLSSCEGGTNDEWPNSESDINIKNNKQNNQQQNKQQLWGWMQTNEKPKKVIPIEEDFPRKHQAQYAGSRVIKEEMQFWTVKAQPSDRDLKFPLRFHEQLYQNYFSTGKKALIELGDTLFWDCIGTLFQICEKNDLIEPQTWASLALVNKEMNQHVVESRTKLILNSDVTILSHNVRMEQMRQTVKKYSKNTTALDLSGAGPELEEGMLAEFVKYKPNSQDDLLDMCSYYRLQPLTWLSLRGSFLLQNCFVHQWAGYLKMIDYLDLSGCWQITQDGIQTLLQQGVHPRTLIFQESHICGPALQILSQNSRLEELELSYPRNLKDTDLGYLYTLTNLKILRVNCKDRKQFNPACLDPLISLTNLQVLDLPAIEGTDDKEQLFLNMYNQNLVRLLCGLDQLEELRVGQWFDQVPGSIIYRLKKLVIDPKSTVSLDLQNHASFPNLEYLEFSMDYSENTQDDEMEFGLLPQLKVLKFVNDHKVNVQWGRIMKVVQNAPQLQELSVFRCILQGFEAAGTAAATTVQKLSLIDVNDPMINFQVFYDAFPNLQTLYLQDLTIPDTFLDTLPPNISNLHLIFVKNVERFRILNLRGRRPFITCDYRKQENMKISVPLIRRQLEDLIVEQEGRQLEVDHLRDILQTFYFGPKDDMRINGIMKSLGARISFDRCADSSGGRNDKSRWMIYPFEIIYNQQYPQNGTVGMSYEERQVFNSRGGYIQFLRSYLKHLKEKLEYTAVFRN